MQKQIAVLLVLTVAVYGQDAVQSGGNTGVAETSLGSEYDAINSTIVNDVGNSTLPEAASGDLIVDIKPVVNSNNDPAKDPKGTPAASSGSVNADIQPAVKTNSATVTEQETDPSVAQNSGQISLKKTGSMAETMKGPNIKETGHGASISETRSAGQNINLVDVQVKMNGANKKVALGAYTTVDEANSDNDQIYLDAALCNGCTPDLIKENQCYLNHTTDCRKYVHCVFKESWTAYNMKCGHGTHWSSELNTCHFSQKVHCPNDVCRNPDLKSYPSWTSNCRAYWACEKSESAPACCPKFHQYINGRCEYQENCTIECPDPCENPELKWHSNPDDCKNYKECKNRLSRPMCCPEKYAFMEGKCVPDETCVLPCQKDATVAEIPEQTSDKAKSDVNPNCNLEGIDDGKKYRFKADPKIIRPCPATLVFNAKICACDYKLEKKTEAEKPKDLSVNTPKLVCKRLVCFDFERDSTPIIYTISNGVKNMNGRGKFDGQSYLAIPYLKKNEEAMKNLKVEFVFKSNQAGNPTQVLVSNCRSGNQKSIHPSLAILFQQGEKANETSSLLYMGMSNTGTFDTVQHTVQPGKWTSVKLIYDGKKMTAETVPVNYKTRKPYGKKQEDSRVLEGGLKKGDEPFKIGKCFENDGFDGYMDDVCITTCRSPNGI